MIKKKSSSQKISQFFQKFGQKSKLRQIRFIIMCGVAVIAYVLTVAKLFFREQLLSSMVPLLIFFIFFHFAFLELRHRGLKRIIGVLLGMMALEILLTGMHNWQVPISLMLFHAAIISLAIALEGTSTDKRTFTARSYFTAGGYVFTIFMTVAYSLFLIGGKGNFDLSCGNLQKTSDSFMETMMTPFTFGKKQIQILGSGANHIKESLKDFFSTNVDDVVILSTQVEVIPVEEEGFGEKILGGFTKLKDNISTAVEENTQLNTGICDLILKKIEKTYEHPAFQFAIVLLLFILLYPFVRISFWVVSGVGLALFEVLYLCKVYKTKKVMREVEELV